MDLLRFGFACLCLFASSARAFTTPDLTDPADLFGKPSAQAAFYERLQNKSAEDFDELILENGPDEPRFSLGRLKTMIDELEWMTQLGATNIATLNRHPSLPWAYQNGNDFFAIEEDESWRSIAGHLRTRAQDFESLDRALSDLPKLREKITNQFAQGGHPFDLQNQTHVSQVCRELVNQFGATRDPRILPTVADLLLLHQFSDTNLNRLDLVTPTERAYILSDRIRQAKRLAIDLKLPGRLNTDFASLSLVAKQTKGLAVFDRKVIVAPMSPFEAIFKGIGPAECVRTTCKRWADALFDDAIHYKVINSGHDDGYIGFHRSKAEYKIETFWYLESIQSPVFSELLRSRGNVRSLLRFFQNTAAKEGARIALPAKDFNTFNSKGVAADLIEMPEFVAAHIKEKLEFQDLESVRKLANFADGPIPTVSQMLATEALYKKTGIIHSLAQNDFTARILAPLLPNISADFYRHGIFDDDGLSLSNDELKTAMAAQSQPLLRKRLAAALAARLEKSGDREGALELRVRAFGFIFKSREKFATFEESLKMLQSEIHPGSHWKDEAIDETLLLVKCSEDFEKVLDFAGTVKQSPGLQIGLHLSRLAPQISFMRLLNLATKVLPQLGEDEERLVVLRELIPKVESTSDFLKLVKALAKKKKPPFPEGKMRDAILRDAAAHVLTQANPKERLAILETVLPTMGVRKIAVSLRTRALLLATSPEEIWQIVKVADGLGSKARPRDTIRESIKTPFLNSRLRDILMVRAVARARELDSGEGFSNLMRQIVQKGIDAHTPKTRAELLSSANTPTQMREILFGLDQPSRAPFNDPNVFIQTLNELPDEKKSLAVAALDLALRESARRRRPLFDTLEFSRWQGLRQLSAAFANDSPSPHGPLASDMDAYRRINRSLQFALEGRAETGPKPPFRCAGFFSAFVHRMSGGAAVNRLLTRARVR